ncbi:SDR family oxidoreductase [Gulosibacter hominis]|uniref:SDR family oxidoreductase n=1 Tax=Gulosibacter hominis TaxID=2770504 RepID=UPI00191B8B02|nr:SDR family oxidoreductase [Gulosibacter hominis]
MSKPVALVTGASSGIGRVIVADLAATHEVIGLGRDTERLANCGANTTLSADLSDVAVFAEGGSVYELVSQLPRLDALVHSAAVGTPGWFADTDTAEWQRQMSTNVIAPAALTRLALPLLRASKGTVVFIGSGVSIRPARQMSVYVATKHALKGMADSLRLEVEPDAIRVATILPGQVATPMQVELQDGIGGNYTPDRYIQPSSVAGAVRFAVDAPAEVQITDLMVRPRPVR